MQECVDIYVCGHVCDWMGFVYGNSNSYDPVTPTYCFPADQRPNGGGLTRVGALAQWGRKAQQLPPPMGKEIGGGRLKHVGHVRRAASVRWIEKWDRRSRQKEKCASVSFPTPRPPPPPQHTTLQGFVFVGGTLGTWPTPVLGGSGRAQNTHLHIHTAMWHSPARDLMRCPFWSIVFRGGRREPPLIIQPLSPLTWSNAICGTMLKESFDKTGSYWSWMEFLQGHMDLTLWTGAGGLLLEI